MGKILWHVQQRPTKRDLVLNKVEDNDWHQRLSFVYGAVCKDLHSNACTHMYHTYMHTHTNMCVQLHEQVCACMWRSENNLGGTLRKTVPLLWKWYFVGLTFTNQVRITRQQATRILLPQLPQCARTSTSFHWIPYWVLGFELKSSYLHGNNFTDWAISPRSCVVSLCCYWRKNRNSSIVNALNTPFVYGGATSQLIN